MNTIQLGCITVIHLSDIWKIQNYHRTILSTLTIKLLLGEFRGGHGFEPCVRFPKRHPRSERLEFSR
jgi:hypothetical protein